MMQLGKEADDSPTSMSASSSDLASGPQVDALARRDGSLLQTKVRTAEGVSFMQLEEEEVAEPPAVAAWSSGWAASPEVTNSSAVANSSAEQSYWTSMPVVRAGPSEGLAQDTATPVQLGEIEAEHLSAAVSASPAAGPQTENASSGPGPPAVVERSHLAGLALADNRSYGAAADGGVPDGLVDNRSYSYRDVLRLLQQARAGRLPAMEPTSEDLAVNGTLSMQPRPLALPPAVLPEDL